MCSVIVYYNVIRNKKKVCKGCNKQTYIFSQGLCKVCSQYKKYNSKKHEYKERRNKDHSFYMQVWDSRDHVCQLCGQSIHNPRSYNFHHILPKSKHPQDRYNPANIAILCWTCHDQQHLKPLFLPSPW